MKITLVNAPVIRYKNKSPKKSLKVKLYSLLNSRNKLKKVSNIIKFNEDFRFGVRAGSRWPWTMENPPGAPHFPFIMAYTASLLRQEGHIVNLIDSVAEEEYSYKKFIKKVKQDNAEIVIIECSTPTIDIDLWMALEISKFTKVALAGPHLTDINAQFIHQKHPEISFLLKGEYILSSLEMVNTKIKGIYESVIVKDLDSIPFPLRDYPFAIKYFDPTMPTEKPQLQIYGSKGCPFKCTFCLWPQTMYNGTVSIREPENIALEIKECISKYGYKSIFFDDDTFNLGTERISKLCDYLKEIGLPWTMMGRLDCSPDWLYDKMIDCGCVGMRFGVETFNVNVLKSINKGLERTDFIKTLIYLSNKYPRLMIRLTMMKDIPAQTEEIQHRDMEILNEIGYSSNTVTRNYQLSSCVPFPGTKMYNDLKLEKGEEFLNNFNLYDGSQDTVLTKEKRKNDKTKK